MGWVWVGSSIDYQVELFKFGFVGAMRNPQILFPYQLIYIFLLHSRSNYIIYAKINPSVFSNSAKFSRIYT